MQELAECGGEEEEEEEEVERCVLLSFVTAVCVSVCGCLILTSYCSGRGKED